MLGAYGFDREGGILSKLCWSDRFVVAMEETGERNSHEGKKKKKKGREIERKRE